MICSLNSTPLLYGSQCNKIPWSCFKRVLVTLQSCNLTSTVSNSSENPIVFSLPSYTDHVYFLHVSCSMNCYFACECVSLFLGTNKKIHQKDIIMQTYSSLKKSSEPENTTLALFLACRPAINSVLLPTAWGYYVKKKIKPLGFC